MFRVNNIFIRIIFIIIILIIIIALFIKFNGLKNDLSDKTEQVSSLSSENTVLNDSVSELIDSIVIINTALEDVTQIAEVLLDSVDTLIKIHEMDTKKIAYLRRSLKVEKQKSSFLSRQIAGFKNSISSLKNLLNNSRNENSKLRKQNNQNKIIVEKQSDTLRVAIKEVVDIGREYRRTQQELTQTKRKVAHKIAIFTYGQIHPQLDNVYRRYVMPFISPVTVRENNEIYSDTHTKLQNVADEMGILPEALYLYLKESNRNTTNFSPRKLKKEIKDLLDHDLKHYATILGVPGSSIIKMINVIRNNLNIK